jgi:predicted dithiol-disulfide oxidoreductase (DUF899 family)
MKTPDAVNVVAPEEWKQAREEMLVKEKEHMRAGDALAAERRRMPWLPVEKDYEFVGPEGKMSFEDLFGGHCQLVVYRAFYDPGITTAVDPFEYPERACGGCSMVADQVAHPAHLTGRDTTLAFVSRAPFEKIRDLQERMGWQRIPWYELTDDWDEDHDVDQWHGTNAFIRTDDGIFRTYMIDGRGDERMGGTWAYLDITALGRQEKWEDSPEGFPQTDPYGWWNYHDQYEKVAA